MKTIDDCIADLPASYSPAFLALLSFVIPHEVVFEHGFYGDYDHVATEHDPNDPGGTTRYGLDAASHPHLDIENLTFVQAAAQYHADVWTPFRCDEIDSEKVTTSLCDAAINCGNARAARWMQAAAQVTQDGNVGPLTIHAVNMLDGELVATAINAARDDYYRNQVRPSLRALYLTGWENRLNDLIATVGDLPDTPNVAQIA